jgi:mitogen-activated protein kinase kinase kinase
MATPAESVAANFMASSSSSPPAHQRSFPPRSSSFRNGALAVSTQPPDASPSPSTSTTQGPSLEPQPGTSYADFLRTWTDAHVARWLADVRCAHQATTFAVHDIRGDVLLELDQTTLKEMGIASIGDRLRILNALKALRARVSAARREAATASSSSPTSTSKSALAGGSGGGTTGGGRKLEAGRPPPLHLTPGGPRSDLPSIIRDGQDSARPRPLPVPTPTTATPQSSIASFTSSSTTSSNTPPTSLASSTPSSDRQRPSGMPPPPRGAAPPPPASAVRTPARNNQFGGYRTPTVAEVNNYNNTPLPPPPGETFFSHLLLL